VRGGFLVLARGRRLPRRVPRARLFSLLAMTGGKGILIF